MKHSTLSLFLLLFSVHPSIAQLSVGFSADDGYKDGPVNRQPSEGDRWREQRPGSYIVDAGKGVLKFDSAAQAWSSVTYLKPLGLGKTYIIAIDFQVTIGSPNLSNGNSMMSRFDLVGGDGPVGASFRQRAQRANFFDLWLFAGLGEPPNPAIQATGFSGDEIGLRTKSGGTAYEKNVSDKLRLIIVHQHTEEGFNFTSAAVLLNLDANKEIQKVVLPGWMATEAWFNQADKNFSISTGNMNSRTADNGATSISINSLKIGLGQD